MLGLNEEFEFSESYYHNFKDKEQEVIKLTKRLQNLQSLVSKYESTLELIAAPKRSDGTYNRCREACELIAKEALNQKVR